MSILDEAKQHLATYGAAHVECCGTPIVRKLVAELEARREDFYEIANRASNMSDPDAGGWLPSIYRIACEASGEDPWPLLRATGHAPLPPEGT